ncbi:MAG: DNRLRE domain-containing protein, partial [Oscillospiraceae bacterium]|nr:DNRLRE domain-containing protein [Oscillospiraceae bacterium]
MSATIRTSPVVETTEIEPEEDRLEDHGDFYVNTADDVNVTLEKTYTDGEALVSVECDGAGVVFYPETVVDAEAEIKTEIDASQIAEQDANDDASANHPLEDTATEVTEETVEQVTVAEPEEPSGTGEPEGNAITEERESVDAPAPEVPAAADEFAPTDNSAPTPASTEITEQTGITAPVATSEPEEESETEENAAPAETSETAEDPASEEEPETEEISTPAEIPEEENTPAAEERSEEETPVSAETPETAEEAAPTEAPEAAEELAPVEVVEPTETTEPEEAQVPAETPDEKTDDTYEPIAIYDSVDGVGTGYANGTYAAVLYSGSINEFTDVEFIPMGNGVKENIIMRQYTTSEISYVLNFSGLTPVLSGRTVLLYDADGEKSGEISAPYLLDANRVYSDDITVSLEKIGSNYRLTYTMNEEWLRTAAYPVVLDPTTYIGKDSDGESASHMEDGYVTSDEPNRSYNGLVNSDMYCGNVYGESLCLFRPVVPDSINEIADYILVKEVKLHTYVKSVSGGNTYSVYQLLGDWSSNAVTYNTCPAYTASNTPSQYISSTGWCAWDLTPAASTWFNSLAQMQEYGVLIRGEKSGGSLVFASSDASANNAYYTITYYPVSQSNPKDPNLKVTAKGNGVNSGTGYLELSWDKVEGAQNYYVGIHNGKEYEYFYVTGTTSWTTKGKGIWPTETEINNGRYSLHHDGKGAELPMIPAFTYNNSGGTLAGNLNYSVCVIPANEYGQAPNPKYFGAKTAKLPDTLPPSQASTVSVSPDTYTNANTITVSWSGIKDYNNKDTSAVASLGTGHVQYSINNTVDWKNTSSSNGTGSAKIDVSKVQDGKNVIYIRATDSAGNTSTPQSLYFYIDRTPPTAPVISVVPEDWSDTDSVSLTWSGISDMNDLLRVEYSVDHGAYVDTGKTDPAYTGYLIDTSALPDGEHTICVRAVDILGNVGEATAVTIYKDTTAPSVTETVIDPDSWTNADEVTFGWTGLTDTHSGMALVWYSVDAGEQITLTTEEETSTALDISALSDGTHTLLLHFEDQVGNSREETLTVYRDATVPDIAILSPADGSAVNGTVEVLGSVRDLSLESWTLTAVGEDGSVRTLASGEEEKDTERLGILNCALYEDGERVQLKLYAVDKAGNESEVTGTAIVVDKSATPISGTVTITAPYKNEQITAPSTDGGYTVDYAQAEADGLLYIDGVYKGNTSDKGFAFDAITYAENSVHSISVLSRAADGTVQFSKGMSSYVLHSDAFEDDALLTSHSGATVDHGVMIDGGSSGTVISQTIKPALPILALRLNVTEDKPAGTDIKYYYSINNESTWTAITPGTDVPLLVRPNTIRLKAELIGNGTASPTLCGWTLQGAIETDPTRVVVKLTRPVKALNVSDTTVSSALTELTSEPKSSSVLRQYRDGAYAANTFTYDAREVKDNETHQVVLVAETADGALYGTGAEVEVLLRENVNTSGTVISDALTGSVELYALRLEALYSDKTSFSYSTDGSTWHTITPGQYTYLEQGSEQVYVRAQGGTLTAWHVEGITCKGTNVTAQIMKAPTNVVAADWGEDYYANEKLRYYVLSWTDPTPKDGTASYTTAYEVYRNGKLIATTESTRYTDNDYVANARYEVRTIRTYKGFSGQSSAKTAATRTSMKAPERVIGVNYTAQEQKQSEYLNKLYGGNYTFSNSAKAPVDDRALDMSLLGRNKMCAYGWEPINFNTGNFLLETADGTWADLGLAELTVDRTYNAQSDAADGPFGAHWSSTWTEHLRLYTEGDVVYVAADGAEIIFAMDANGVYTGGESRGLTLTISDDSREYLITNLDGVIHAFTGMGLLNYIQWSDGNRITVNHDADGLMTGFTLPSGKTLDAESDKSGHITAIATLGGSTLKYEYEGNDLVAFTDADGSVTRYVYDSQSRMTEWYDAENIRQVKNTYDSKSRVIAQIDANGGEYSLEYFDDHTVITDADAQISEIWYDEQKRTTRTVDANGGEMGYEYDQFGNIVAMTDENGNTTRYEYDAAGNKIRETAPDGSSYSLAYDAHNNLTQLTDQLGNVTRYEYDEHNRLTRQTNPDGGETTYTYNAAGQTLTVTDALGNTTAYAYDGANLISSTDPNGNTTAYAYDSENRLVSTTDALGNVTAFAYDGADNLTSVTFADGTSFSYEYDRVGNLISQTDALGSVTTFEYDALRQLVKTTYPDGSEATGSYDASGNLISTTDADGNTATAAYDAVGNLVAVTDALGNTTAYEYDSAGNLTAQTLANGRKTQYNYDNIGQLISTVTATGETTGYTYDAAGNLLTVNAPDGGVTAYAYDSMGRLLTETAP